MGKFYVTAAIPYVNAKPHIGHALEYVQVDAIKRYQRLQGKQAVSLSGGDENALKNVQAAEKAGRDIQEFIDEHTETFRQLAIKLNAEFDFWQKGSNKETHFPSSQDLWRRCEQNGDIYKKVYRGLYCVGCESFYETEELVNGECPEHPGKKLDEVTEENYFFRLSKYQEQLAEIIRGETIKIVPDFRKNEALDFLEKGLCDISISRSNERAKNWGVPVPGDTSQRIYVWFDALNIYRSGVPQDYWPADLHVIGKGIARFHTIYWPAFLLSAQLPLPKAIFIHGYLTVNGQKISKSNPETAIDPFPLIEKYGADAIRYYLLAKISPFHDGDFTEDKLREVYNADLANGLGNLVSRIEKLAQTAGFAAKPYPPNLLAEVQNYFDNYRFDLAAEFLWQEIKRLNTQIDTVQPWKLANANLAQFLEEIIPKIQNLAYNLAPFIPNASQQIITRLSGQITAYPPLFPRIT